MYHQYNNDNNNLKNPKYKIMGSRRSE
jgi:hypothetical protein